MQLHDSADGVNLIPVPGQVYVPVLHTDGRVGPELPHAGGVEAAHHLLQLLLVLGLGHLQSRCQYNESRMELKELFVPLNLLVDSVQDLLGATGGLGDEVPLVPVVPPDAVLLYLCEQQRVLYQPLVLHRQDGLQLQPAAVRVLLQLGQADLQPRVRLPDQLQQL